MICLLYSLMSAVNAVADADLSAMPLCLFLAMGIAAAWAMAGSSRRSPSGRCSGSIFFVTFRNLAIAALFIFPGLSGFPQGVQLDEAPFVEAAQMFGGNVFLSHTILIP